MSEPAKDEAKIIALIADVLSSNSLGFTHHGQAVRAACGCMRDRDRTKLSETSGRSAGIGGSLFGIDLLLPFAAMSA